MWMMKIIIIDSNINSRGESLKLARGRRTSISSCASSGFDTFSSMASSKDALLSSTHGGKSFVPKNYHTAKDIVGHHDARSSVRVKTNHSGDVPHFIYEGALADQKRIEEDLVSDPMNGKSTVCYFLQCYKRPNGCRCDWLAICLSINKVSFPRVLEC